MILIPPMNSTYARIVHIFFIYFFVISSDFYSFCDFIIVQISVFINFLGNNLSPKENRKSCKDEWMIVLEVPW